MGDIQAFFRFCPSCGRRFHIKLVSKKLVDMSKETTQMKQVQMVPRAPFGSMSSSMGGVAFNPVIVQQDVPVEIDRETFQYQYKCKQCGHEWTENRIEHETRKMT
jgi:DNA-directed RNA polymerase subunit RPC12/RpoP